ncbi:hypothetical protein OAU50_04385 [Planctomycetota bacterium]|nr:hypothetical protein [Planctomycetota bacterium]
MQYIKVICSHKVPEDPILLFSELDDERWELRKIEIYQDGKVDYAGEGIVSGDIGLSLEPIPELHEIAEQSQFQPTEITAEEFESEWTKALNKNNGE